jgi:UDP-N-acetyl-D-mannosaminuronate dehydrogenase
MKVSIIGTGYVGLTTGVCLGFLGHKVTCIDSDPKKIGMLQAGKTPIYEPFLTELMAAAAPNLQFCTEYAGAVKDADVIFIAVGTPPFPRRQPRSEVSPLGGPEYWTALRRRFSGGGEQIHSAHRQRQLGGFSGARIL